MIIEEKVINEEGRQITYYKCKEDNEVLWFRYDNGTEGLGGSCSHYEWEMIGNGCYPQQLDEEICKGTENIVRESIKKIDEGLTIWFLVPTHS
jgi:hypothetical protein